MKNLIVRHICSHANINRSVLEYFRKKVDSAQIILSYLDAISDCYKINTGCIYLEDENNEIQGVLFYYYIGSVFFGKRLFTPKFGVAGEDGQVFSVLFENLLKISDSFKIHSITVLTDYVDCNFPGVVRNIKKQLKIDLMMSKQMLWKSLRDKTRNAIRKGEKKGIEIKKGNQYLSEFYLIYSERMKNVSSSLHSYEFFQKLIESNESYFNIYLALHNKKPIAAVFIQYTQKIAYYAFSGTLRGFEKMCPIHFLLWTVIEDCYDKKLSALDMGESRLDSGSYKFKVWFGASPIECYHYTFQFDYHKKFFLFFQGILRSIKNKFFCLLCVIAPSKLEKWVLLKRKLSNRII